MGTLRDAVLRNYCKQESEACVLDENKHYPFRFTNNSYNFGENLISSDEVEQAMLAVDRAKYCPEEYRGTKADHAAYQDRPLPIGYEATISAPHMHAQCLELLLEHIIRPGCRILDVGSGSGYLVACIASIIARHNSPGAAKVVGIDRVAELVDMSVKNIESDRFDLLDDGYAELHAGDGYQGWSASAPYDAIHVGAAAPSIPAPLIEQLKEGGRLVIPVGTQGGDQWLTIVDKKPGGQLVKTQFEAVRYVPLVPGQSSTRAATK